MPLAYGLAGALSGFGTGIVEEARNKREERLLWMKREWQLADRADEREWQAGQAGLQFERQKELGEIGHNRQLEIQQRGSGKIVTDENGNTNIIRNDGTVLPVTGPGGEPFRTATGRDPSDPRFQIEAKRDMLIAAGWDPDLASEAAALGERPISQMDRMRLVEDQLKTEYGREMATNDRLREQIRARREELLKNLDRMIDQRGSRSSQQSGEAPQGRLFDDGGPPPAGERGLELGGMATVPERPEGVTDESLIQQAKDAIARGKDANRIRYILRKWGIDPKSVGL